MKVIKKTTTQSRVIIKTAKSKKRKTPIKRKTTKKRKTSKKRKTRVPQTPPGSQTPIGSPWNSPLRLIGSPRNTPPTTPVFGSPWNTPYRSPMINTPSPRNVSPRTPWGGGSSPLPQVMIPKKVNPWKAYALLWKANHKAKRRNEE